MHSTRLFSIALSLMLLTACVTPPTAPTGYGSPSSVFQNLGPTTESITVRFEGARDIVEDDRGIDLSDISLSLLSSQEMPFALSDLYGRKANPAMTFDTRMRLFAGSAIRDSRYVQAVYDPYGKRIVINRTMLGHRIQTMKRQGISRHDTIMTVLIHELIHAADDKQFNLIAIENNHVGDKLGLSFVAEGSAEMHTKRLCARAGCGESRIEEYLSLNTDRNEEQLYIVGPMQQRNALVYQQGENFLTALSRRDPTGSLVDTAMRTPPGDVVEFFTPEKYPDVARAKRRKSIYTLLDGLKLSHNESPLLKIPEPPFELSDLPQGIHAQHHYVTMYGEKIIASGAMSYVDQYDPEPKTTRVSIFQGSSIEALLEKKQDILDKNQAHTRTLMQIGVGVHYPDAEVLEAWSKDVPANTQRYIVQLTQIGSGKSVTLFTSLLIEGNFLISISNVDNNALNKLALDKAFRAVKRL